MINTCDTYNKLILNDHAFGRDLNFKKGRVHDVIKHNESDEVAEIQFSFF